jgi:hypothetical protein
MSLYVGINVRCQGIRIQTAIHHMSIGEGTGIDFPFADNLTEEGDKNILPGIGTGGTEGIFRGMLLLMLSFNLSPFQ